MIDWKITAAVFASLTVIAFAMQGTTMIETTNETVQETDENQTETKPINTVTETISQLITSIREPPEPETPVEAEIQTVDLNQHQQDIKKAEITSPDLNQIKIDQQKIEATNPLTLKNYTGSIIINETQVEIIGDAQEASNGEIKLTNLKINQKIETEKIEIIEQKRSTIQFANSTGTITTEDQTQIEIENENFHTNSFTGNQTANLNENTIEFEGKLDRLQTDHVSIE